MWIKESLLEKTYNFSFLLSIKLNPCWTYQLVLVTPILTSWYPGYSVWVFFQFLLLYLITFYLSVIKIQQVKTKGLMTMHFMFSYITMTVHFYRHLIVAYKYSKLINTEKCHCGLLATFTQHFFYNIGSKFQQQFLNTK